MKEAWQTVNMKEDYSLPTPFLHTEWVYEDVVLFLKRGIDQEIPAHKTNVRRHIIDHERPMLKWDGDPLFNDAFDIIPRDKVGPGKSTILTWKCDIKNNDEVLQPQPQVLRCCIVTFEQIYTGMYNAMYGMLERKTMLQAFEYKRGCEYNRDNGNKFDSQGKTTSIFIGMCKDYMIHVVLSCMPMEDGSGHVDMQITKQKYCDMNASRLSLTDSVHISSVQTKPIDSFNEGRLFCEILVRRDVVPDQIPLGILKSQIQELIQYSQKAAGVKYIAKDMQYDEPQQQKRIQTELDMICLKCGLLSLG